MKPNRRDKYPWSKTIPDIDWLHLYSSGLTDKEIVAYLGLVRLAYTTNKSGRLPQDLRLLIAYSLYDESHPKRFKAVLSKLISKGLIEFDPVTNIYCVPSVSIFEQRHLNHSQCNQDTGEVYENEPNFDDL